MKEVVIKSGEVPSGVRKRRRRPADTIEGRENQMIALTYDLVEKRLREGTATSQETTHFLKLGSTKEKKELELLEIQKELLKSKKQQLDSQVEMKEMLKEAMEAFSSYAPRS